MFCLSGECTFTPHYEPTARPCISPGNVLTVRKIDARRFEGHAGERWVNKRIRRKLDLLTILYQKLREQSSKFLENATFQTKYDATFVERKEKKNENVSCPYGIILLEVEKTPQLKGLERGIKIWLVSCIVTASSNETHIYSNIPTCFLPNAIPMCLRIHTQSHASCPHPICPSTENLPLEIKQKLRRLFL